MRILEVKTCNMLLTEEQQKYEQCHQVNLISKNILHGYKYYLPIKVK